MLFSVQVNILASVRANPYPEAANLICRLPLPTLFYRLEAINLGDQMRLLVRPDLRKSFILRFFNGQA